MEALPLICPPCVIGIDFISKGEQVQASPGNPGVRINASSARVMLRMEYTEVHRYRHGYIDANRRQTVLCND